MEWVDHASNHDIVKPLGPLASRGSSNRSVGFSKHCIIIIPPTLHDIASSLGKNRVSRYLTQLSSSSESREQLPSQPWEIERIAELIGQVPVISPIPSN